MSSIEASLSRPSGSRGFFIAALRADLPASVVVFLIALPLCLGIAVASGAPPLAGLITGIVAGFIVSWISGSHVAVSGPAAGLTVIVLSAIDALGYPGLLLATCLAGAMQIAFGALRAGVLAHYFPSSVIKGMLAAIGLILILKQFPHAIGFDGDFEGDEAFVQRDGRNTLTEIPYALGHFHIGATILAALGLALLVLLDRTGLRQRVRWLPGPLLVVVLGVALNAAFIAYSPELAIRGSLLVELPTGGLTGLIGEVTTPDLSLITSAEVWTTAFTIAVVASLETLLCVDALDRLDPDKRITPTNRELVAQGIGNMIAGALGGIPMTAVIVRGSANLQAGAKTRLSAFAHGMWLLLAVLLLPRVMGLVPLAALAAVLLYVGYQLSPLRLYRHMVRQPLELALPFAVTIIGVILTDLLKGVGIGLAIAVLFVLVRNARSALVVTRREEGERDRITIRLAENVSFFDKASVRRALDELPAGCSVEIDGSAARHVHPDVLELVHDLASSGPSRNIEVVLVDIPHRPGEVPSH